MDGYLSISVGQQPLLLIRRFTYVTETSGSVMSIVRQTGGTGLATLIDVISPALDVFSTFTIPFGFQLMVLLLVSMVVS